MRGIWYVLPTPFSSDGAVDDESLHSLVEACTIWGVDGITVLGVMAEISALTEAERTQILDVVFGAAEGRMPITVGCSGTSAEVVLARISEARDRGAAAVMVAPPPLLADLDRLPTFYERVARGGVPLVIQDEPRTTGVRIPTSILIDAADQSNARAIKLEDPPTPPKISALVKARPKTAVFGGLGGVAALMELARGASGLMTGFAIPEILIAVFEAWDAGNRAKAAAIFERYLPLITLEGQVGIGLGIRKETLKRRGVIRDSTVRISAAVIDDDTRRELVDFTARAGLVLGPDRMSVSGGATPGGASD